MGNPLFLDEKKRLSSVQCMVMLLLILVFDVDEIFTGSFHHPLPSPYQCIPSLPLERIKVSEEWLIEGGDWP